MDAKFTSRTAENVSADLLEGPSSVSCGIVQSISTTESRHIYPEPLYTEAKFCAVLYTEGKKVVKAVFRTFFSHPENIKSERGTASFSKWQQNVGMSNKRLKNIFGSRFQAPDLVKDDICIQTYCLLITKMDENFYAEKFCPKCQDRLETLKEWKNQVIHRVSLLSAKFDLGKLLLLCQKLLECSAVDLGNQTYIEPVLKELLNQKKIVLDSRAGLVSWDASLEPVVVGSLDNYVRMSQAELRKKGSSRIFAIPFYWIANCFSDETEWVLKGNDLFENVAMDVFTNPFVQYNSFKFESKDILFPKIRAIETPQVIFIKGHGGCGKTTLCNHIFSKWLNKDINQDLFYEGLEAVDLAVFIEMRSVRSTSLLQFLQYEYIQESVSTLQEEALCNFLCGLNILYIIDGFDEQNKGNVNVVHDIAKSLLLSQHKVILTTRPECLSEVQRIFSVIQANNILVIDLVGFDEAGREKFSSKILSHEYVKSIYPTAVPVDFCAFLSEQEKTLSSYLNFPLTIALVLLLWLRTRNRKQAIHFCTATHLYRELFNMLTNKLIMARLHAGDNGFCINKRSVRAVMEVLSQSALSAILFNNFRLEIPSSVVEKIHECCEEYDVKFIEFMSTFTQFLSEPKMGSQEPLFSFFHRTEMEYLSAQSLVQTLISSQPLPELPFEDMHKFYGVLPFVVGVLSAHRKLDQYDSKIINHLISMEVSSRDLNLFSKLITESSTYSSHGNPCKKRFCSLLCDLMPSSTWHLDASTVLSGLHILHHCTSIALWELTIDLALGFDPNEMPGLSEHFVQLRLSLCRRELPYKILVSFHITNHYDYGGRVSDHYLPFLVGWAKLVKFTGAIGSEGVEHLSTFSCLNYLKLRISSSVTFNKFVQHVFSKCKKLERMELILDFPMNMELSLLQLKCKHQRQLDLRLRFDSVAREDLRATLHVIKSIWSPSIGAFDKITFRSSNFILEEDAPIIKNALKDLVYNKVCVSSGTRSSRSSDTIPDKDCGFIFQWSCSK